MKNINFKIQSSLAQNKLNAILQEVFSTCQYTIDNAFNTPTHWANVYKVTLNKRALYQPGDKTYIVRILNLAHTTLEDRQKEILSTQKMAELGVGPKVYYGNPHLGVIVMSYIPVQPMKKDTATAFLTSLAHKLKRLHGVDPTPYMPMGSKKLNSLFTRVAKTVKPELNLFQSGLLRPSKFMPFEKALKAYGALRKILGRDVQRSVTLCHLDLNATNLLFDGAQAWIIDWDMVDQGDPYFDLATVINTLNLDAVQEELFLEAYCERPLTEMQKARLHVLKQLCYLRYAITTFGLCTGYKSLPVPQGLMQKLRPAFVFPSAEEMGLSKSMALYMLALAFYQEAKTNMSDPAFTHALDILNHHTQEKLDEDITAFCND